MLTRLRNRLALRRRRPGFHSRFGGLWTDRLDPAEVERRIRARSGAEADRLADFVERGVTILPGAVPEDAIDELSADVERVWEGRDPSLLVEVGGVRSPVTPEARSGHGKLLDLHVRSQAALRLAFAEPLASFLRAVFEEDPLLFQSLYFERGSQQAVHQDTAYVVVVPPLAMVAAWIALEDVRPGSGELAYYPGSHRLPEHLFGAGQRNWNRERDGEAARLAYERGLHASAREQGLELETFLPRRGDVLVWSADLAHGGSPVLDPRATRRSLVCHYCPASARPYYTGKSRRGRRRREAAPGSAYSSAHYGST